MAFIHYLSWWRNAWQYERGSTNGQSARIGGGSTKKKLHKEKAQTVKALAVVQQDDSGNSATASDVLAVRPRETAWRTEDLVCELHEQLQQLMLEVSHLQRRNTTFNQRGR